MGEEHKVTMLAEQCKSLRDELLLAESEKCENLRQEVATGAQRLKEEEHKVTMLAEQCKSLRDELLLAENEKSHFVAGAQGIANLQKRLGEAEAHAESTERRLEVAQARTEALESKHNRAVHEFSAATHAAEERLEVQCKGLGKQIRASEAKADEAESHVVDDRKEVRGSLRHEATEPDLREVRSRRNDGPSSPDLRSGYRQSVQSVQSGQTVHGSPRIVTPSASYVPPMRYPTASQQSLSCNSEYSASIRQSSSRFPLPPTVSSTPPGSVKISGPAVSNGGRAKAVARVSTTQSTEGMQQRSLVTTVMPLPQR